MNYVLLFLHYLVLHCGFFSPREYRFQLNCRCCSGGQGHVLEVIIDEGSL